MIKTEIEDIKCDIIYELKETKREGIENLIEYMENSGFFSSPASTKYHGSYEGGLAKHCLGVRSLFVAHIDKFNQFGNISKESVSICSLLHDLCKIGAYMAENGGYRYNPKQPKGHSKLSIERIEKFIKLTDLEKLIIKYHMGYYGAYEFSNEKGEYRLLELAEANNNPLTKLFYWCDDMESQFGD